MAIFVCHFHRENINDGVIFAGVVPNVHVLPRLQAEASLQDHNASFLMPGFNTFNFNKQLHLL